MAERMLSSKSASLSLPITLPEDQFNSGMIDRFKTDVRCANECNPSTSRCQQLSRSVFVIEVTFGLPLVTVRFPRGTFRLPRVTQLLPPREAIPPHISANPLFWDPVRFGEPLAIDPRVIANNDMSGCECKPGRAQPSMKGDEKWK